MPIKPRRITPEDRRSLLDHALAIFVGHAPKWPGPGEPPDLGELTEDQALALIGELARGVGTRRAAQPREPQYDGEQRLMLAAAKGADRLVLSRQLPPGSLIKFTDGLPESVALDICHGTGPWTHTLPAGQRTLYQHEEGAGFIVVN